MTNKNRWILIGVAAAFVAIVVSMVVFLWPEPLFQYENVTEIELWNPDSGQMGEMKKVITDPEDHKTILRRLERIQRQCVQRELPEDESKGSFYTVRISYGDYSRMSWWSAYGDDMAMIISVTDIRTGEEHSYLATPKAREMFLELYDSLEYEEEPRWTVPTDGFPATEQ